MNGGPPTASSLPAPAADGEEVVIDVENLAVSYGDHLALKEVALEVRRGGVSVIVGGSGSGKTTLLKAIIGLAPISSGRIRLLDRELGELTEAEGRALLQRIGVMFQGGALLNSITVGENVALPLEMHTSLKTDLVAEIARTRLRLVGLEDAADKLPAELSGGMRKRAALARAMAMDPEILFCDEPGAGLDPITAAEIDRLLLTVNESLGTTLVVVTHELLSIERLGGELLMIDGGRVLFSGSTSQALQSSTPQLKRFFQPA